MKEVFISGNHPQLGNWKPNALSLVNQGGIFYGKLTIPEHYPLQFKVTLGDWFHAEVFEDGKERPNRNLIGQGRMVDIHVENFRVRSFHPKPKTASSNIRYHYDFYSEGFDNYRNLAVYLPPQYFTEPESRFPVLYALDGNNLFDRATSTFGEEWKLDETLATVFLKGELPPWIVVGIYNTDKRTQEYLACDHGKAHRFAEFFLNTIKPLIDEQYRTLSDRNHTAILGSSFGGNFALFSMYQIPGVFSRFAAMSPALWRDNYCLNNLLKGSPPKLPHRLWIDMGDREGWDDSAVEFKNGVQDVEHAYEILRRSGIPATSLKKYIHRGGIHHESSWGERAGEVLKFLLPLSKTQQRWGKGKVHLRQSTEEDAKESEPVGNGKRDSFF